MKDLETPMKKPYVFIHTLTSLDARIRNIELPEFDSEALQYEQLALHADPQVLNIPGYLNERISANDNFTHDRQQDLKLCPHTVSESDFVAQAQTLMYCVALDSAEHLGRQESHFDYGGLRAHVLSLFTQRASNATTYSPITQWKKS